MVCSGFVSPVAVQVFLVLGGLGILLGLLPSNFVRTIALGTMVSVFVILLIRNRLRVIRQGDDVEVVSRGRCFGRRGTVVAVLEPESRYEVDLYEISEQDTTIPSEIKKLYRFELEKLP